MCKRAFALWMAFVLCLVPFAAWAQPLEQEIPLDLGETAAVLLMEADSGTVIFEKNADEKRPVASITKLMTILLVLEALDEGRFTLEQKITASKEAAGMGGSQVLLDAGGVYTGETLLKSLIVASANDAAVALAEHLAGSEQSFVTRMNQRAAELGLVDTVYMNCTGLPAQGQHTTARDVARLSAHVLAHKPFFQYSTIWMDTLTHNSGRETQLVNTNRLIRFYQGADGVKTGSTNEAGFCVSATAQRGGLRYIAVVLGCKSGKLRFNVAGRLLDYGFDHYGFVTLHEAGKPVEQKVAVTNAKDVLLELTLEETLRIFTKRGEEGEYTVELSLPENVSAPIEKGDPVGEMVVFKGGSELVRVPLSAAFSVAPTGYFVNLGKVLRGWIAGKTGS